MSASIDSLAEVWECLSYRLYLAFSNAALGTEYLGLTASLEAEQATQFVRSSLDVTRRYWRSMRTKMLISGNCVQSNKLNNVSTEHTKKRDKYCAHWDDIYVSALQPRKLRRNNCTSRLFQAARCYPFWGILQRTECTKCGRQLG